jgi:hypothetical protein
MIMGEFRTNHGVKSRIQGQKREKKKYTFKRFWPFRSYPVSFLASIPPRSTVGPEFKYGYKQRRYCCGTIHSESWRRRETSVKAARHIPCLNETVDDLDTNHWLLNVEYI